MDLMMVVDDGSEVLTSYYFGIKLRYGLMGSSKYNTTNDIGGWYR